MIRCRDGPWDWEEVRLLRADLRLPVLGLGDVSIAAAIVGTLLSEISVISNRYELLTNSVPSISTGTLPVRGKVECDRLSTVSDGGTAASGIFCLLDRRTEELGCGSVARLFSALETFRFRDSDGGGAVGGEDSGKVAADAGDAAGARAAWLAAWRAEDLVILGDMRNLPRRLLARAQGAEKEWGMNAGRRIENPASTAQHGCGYSS